MAGFWRAVLPDTGQVVELSAYCNIRSNAGIGLMPIELSYQNYGIREGAALVNQLPRPRVITLTCMAYGANVAGLHKLRSLLVSVFKPDRQSARLPIELQYTGSGKTVAIKCYYDSGLEYNATLTTFEHFALRFVSLDPYWQDTADVSLSLSYAQTFDVKYLAAKIEGAWRGYPGSTGLASAAQPSFVYEDKQGKVYISGGFTAWGGNSNNKGIAKYSGLLQWYPIGGTGLAPDGAKVNCAVQDATGYLFFGGNFTGAGGKTVNGIFSYKESTDEVSGLGSGLNSMSGASVNDMAIGPDGKLYVVGSFTGVGGVANTANIARWNGSIWESIGQANGAITSAKFGRDGYLYVQGAFSQIGGKSLPYVALYDPTSNVWKALGGYPNVAASCLCADDLGQVYLGGDFITIDGIPFNRIAKWSGVQWQALGTGANQKVKAVTTDKDNNLYLAGDFSALNGELVNLPLAKWNGSRFYPVLLELPNDPVSLPFARVSDNGNLFVLTSETGIATVPGSVNVSYTGGAKTYPVITITGPGTLTYLENSVGPYTIYFAGLTLVTGETLTIDLSPSAKTITSSVKGNMLHKLVPGSDFGNFAIEAAPLAPDGLNVISAHIMNATADTTITMSYRNRYWSSDGV